jgi:hypothetical protein
VGAGRAHDRLKDAPLVGPNGPVLYSFLLMHAYTHTHRERHIWRVCAEGGSTSFSVLHFLRLQVLATRRRETRRGCRYVVVHAPLMPHGHSERCQRAPGRGQTSGHGILWSTAKQLDFVAGFIKQ